MQRECESCGNTFEARRSTARFCTATCRSRAARAARAAASVAELEAAAAAAQADQPAAGSPAEHDLVKAVRDELAAANALGTVAGQLALQVARRIAEPDGSGISALSKELRSLLVEAKGAAPKPAPAVDGPAQAEPEDDEVTAARRAREAKLSAAAGRA